MNQLTPGIRVDVEIPAHRMRKPASVPPHGIAVFRLGFRIFFLLGATSAIALVLAWIGVYAFGFSFPNRFDLIQWHAHEMLFGFATAIIAGFLLTAPGNWTRRPMPAGGKLAVLAALWLAGRIALFFPAYLPGWIIMLVDVAFLPALGLTVFLTLRGLPLQRPNMVFPTVLLGMTAANVLAHLGIRNRLGVAVGTELMLYLVLMMIVLMGGRVIPGFTIGQFPEGTTRVRPAVDKLAIGSLLALIPADLLAAPYQLIAGLCLAAGITHAIRLADWNTRELWRVPLLWILHIGYGWLVIGMFLKAGGLLGVVPPLIFRHALTAGAIGVVVLGMISRVALGHTGRALKPPPLITAAFVLVNLAVILRVAFPWFAPQNYLLWLILSASAWIVAFSLYLVEYTQMLCAPRADGRPG